MATIDAANLGVPMAILAMAAATYLTRIAGFWLMAHVPVTARVRRMLEALPGSIVAATVLPFVLQSGASAVFAVSAAAGAMIVFRNDFAAVAAGMLVAVFARSFGF